MYEGTYWDLLANIGELTEALTQMAVGRTVLEEPVLQLPPSSTLPSWDNFKPVLQPLPPLPQVRCCALLWCAALCFAGLRWAALCYPEYAVLCCAVLCCAVLCCAVLCCAVLCCAVLCCAVLCCAVLCCIVHCALCHHCFFLDPRSCQGISCLLLSWRTHQLSCSHTPAGRQMVRCFCHLCKCDLHISILPACSPA